MAKRLGSMIIAAALVAAPVAIASARHLKLTAVVTGQTTLHGIPATTYSVREGSKHVGAMAVGVGNCAGRICIQSGTADLKVGKVRGKAKLQVTDTFQGCPPACNPGGPTAPKLVSVKGTISNAKHGSEKITVNGKFPTTKGSKVTFVVSY